MRVGGGLEGTPGWVGALVGVVWSGSNALPWAGC